MKNFVLTTLFTIAFGFCLAQEILTVNSKAKFLTRVGFTQFNGGVVLLRAQFDALTDTLNFILDTGSSGISLDSATCQEFKIPVTATDTSVSGVGGLKKVGFVFNKSLHLPNLTVPNLNFHVNDYELLGAMYGVKIDGIIGYSFFKNYIVAINYDSSFLDVYTPGQYKYPRGGYTLNPLFTALPIQWAKMRDATSIDFNFYLDSGAGLYLLVSEQFAKDSALFLKRRRPVITQAEGIAGRAKLALTILKEFKIGPYKFKNVPTYIFPDAYNALSYPFIGGLIGNDLLRRFNVIYNYPKRQIHLLPNKQFTEPFDYAYTGLSLYSYGFGVVVDNVAPNSPAEIAGLKIGDTLTSVAGNISNNVQTYKDILQVANRSIAITVRRNNQEKLLLLRTKSIK
jgi:predicted aspartyl protease